MTPMTPEQASFLLHGLYLPGLQNEHRITKGVIAAILPDQSDFRPDQYSRPALDLAWHIVTAEILFTNAVAAGQFDFTPMPKPEGIKNSADLVAWYETHFAQQMEKLKALSPDALVKIVDFRGMFQLPAVMYCGFIMSHTIHHRGQLSVYLRPMGSKVPAIYGESYDSAEARKAAQG